MIQGFTVKEIVEVPTAKLIPNDRNRGTNKVNKTRLMKSMSTYGFRPEMPIWVDKDLNIIDGHHRYAAASQLSIPRVPVVQVDMTIPFDEFIQLSNVRKSWSTKDWCLYYLKDNADYGLILHYAEEFSLSPMRAAILIGGSTHSYKHAIPKGSFRKVDDKLFDCKVTTYRKLLKDYPELHKIITHGPFIEVISQCLCVADKDRFLSKWNKAAKAGCITLQRMVLEYKDLFNKIYNGGVEMANYVDLWNKSTATN